MDETPELPGLLPAVTYLREVALEAQELFMELRHVGFTETQATNIVAQMVSHAIDSRDEDQYMIVYTSEDDDDMNEDDPYDDGITGH